MKISNFRGILEKGHFQVWISAIFFAIILWLFVISEHKYTYIVEVPIEVRNIKEGKTLSAEVVPTADVKFRATGRAFFKTLLLKSISDFKLVLDLERIRTEYDFYLNDYFDKYAEKIVIPPGFELDYIEVVRPDSIHISLDDYMIKPVRVKINVEVQPAPRYIQVGELSYSPKRIDLKGPKEIIRSVNEVETNDTSFLNLQVPIRELIPLNIDFSRVVEASHPAIEIFADIQSIGERIIFEVPVKVINKLEEYQVFPTPSTVSLTVIGGVEFIASLEPDDIKVIVDFGSQWEINKYYYKPTVIVPNDVIEWRDLSPKNIELSVTRIRQ